MKHKIHAEFTDNWDRVSFSLFSISFIQMDELFADMAIFSIEFCNFKMNIYIERNKGK